MERRDFLVKMAEFPALGSIGLFGSPNPARNDPTRYNLINADQLVAGVVKGGRIEGSALDIAAPSVTGLHIDSDGNLAIGGTTATDSTAPFRVTSAGVGTFEGGITASSIDIPDVGQTGYHVDSSGNFGIGGTTATDTNAEFRVTALGAVTASAIEIRTLATNLLRGSWSASGGIATYASGAHTIWDGTADLFSAVELGVNVLKFGPGGSSSHDVVLSRASAGLLHLSAGNLWIDNAYLEITERTAPGTPAANDLRIFAQDNGAGKTQLMALFSTGAAQQIAIQP